MATSGFKGELRKQLEAQRAYLFLPWLLTVCKSWRPFLFLVEVCCRRCKARFCICRRCWRGQAYCSEGCRLLGRRSLHREAQRRYRQTEKGKKAHRQGENRRRHGWSKKNGKKMDDSSSTGLPSWVIGLVVYACFVTVRRLDRVGRCHFCGCQGRVVDRFPRRE